MKCRTVKSEQWRIQWVLLALFTFCFASCKDDETSATSPYDPNKLVEITDFVPKSGSGNTQMVIYGSNFGTDPSLVSVTIGGKKAVIVSVSGNNVYCLVPSKAYEGYVRLTVDKSTAAVAKDKFKYERQMVVSTLYGRTRPDGGYDAVDGTFDEAHEKYYGVQEPTWLTFDPKNPDHLYMAQDNNKPLRLFDLKNKKVTNILASSGAYDRMRTVAWTLAAGIEKADTMIIACDKGGDGDNSSIFVTREGGFKNVETLAQGKQCNGSFAHPKNGELYYNSFGKGDIYRYDYWTHGINTAAQNREFLCSIQDNDWEFNMIPHPSGDYAYIVVVNRHYIMRMNYNWDTKHFGTPYLICGTPDVKGWEDKVGASARLNSPYQGVFVKNKAYEAAEKKDIYDFYFTDRSNHCIRTLTPDGMVTTFAGRGSLGVNTDAHGYIDGPVREKARFNQPAGLAYDESTETFYVGDIDNHRIRKITLEEQDKTELVENN